MQLKYFSFSDSPEELKRKYRDLSKKYHPDVPGGGNKEVFQEMSAEYAFLRKNQQQLQPQSNFYGHSGYQAPKERSIEDEIDELLRSIKLTPLQWLGIGLFTGFGLFTLTIVISDNQTREARQKRKRSRKKCKR